MEAIKNALSRIPKQYYLPIGIGCVSLILFSWGIGMMLFQGQSREKTNLDDFSQASSSAALQQVAVKKIAVDVEGAVASPSVYMIQTTGRVQDALIAAGGLSAKADRTWVAQHINLAAKLLDGAKIYIPALGEKVEATTTGNSTGTLDQNQQININTASADQLDSLPGVGPVTAQKIIAGRPYNTVEDLSTRKIVSNSVYIKIKDSIVCY